MINKGIKAPILLKKQSEGNNGYFYVSLSKKEECEISIYNKLSSSPMFIIDGNIKAIKARNFRKYGASYPIWITNSPLPFRDCEYDDEYQKFLKISPKDILAIQYNIFSNYQQYNNKNKAHIKNQLLVLKSMIETLDSQKINLQIIDASTSTKINKEKVLTLKI